MVYKDNSGENELDSLDTWYFFHSIWQLQLLFKWGIKIKFARHPDDTLLILEGL